MRKDFAECVRLLKDAEPRIACCWLMDLALAAMVFSHLLAAHGGPVAKVLREGVVRGLAARH